MFYVYILKSTRGMWLYKGQTNNLEKRIEMHNEGKVKSTRNKRLLILVHKEVYQTRSEAMKREKYLKSLEGGTRIKEYLKKENLI